MRPSERLTVLFLLALSAASAAFCPAAGRLALLAGLALATAGLARTGAAAGPLGLLRDVVVPVVVVVATFSVLDPVITAVNPARHDGALAAFDARWLGGLLEAWRGALGRPDRFTDLAYVAYASFYLLPLTAFLLARARGEAAMERVAFTVLLGFYLSYLGYLLWPAAGPRVPEEEEWRLGGGAVAWAVRWFLRTAEATTLDAFPSGHTALSLVAAALGTRLAPRVAPLLVGWAAAVVFSTVSVHVHYGADLLAGAVLALLTLALAPAAARALGGRRTGTRPGGAAVLPI